MYDDERTNAVISCGCGTLVLLFNFFVGAWSVQYILAWFGKEIAWIGAALIGLVAGEITIPIALVLVILEAFGV